MRQTYEKERVSLNVARLKSHGENFEVVIEPEAAIKFRHGDADIRDALKAEQVFREAIKGELASEQAMMEVFKTTDALKIADRIIKEGSIQVNDEYRDKLRIEKKKQFIDLVVKNAADANTGAPLTATRVSNAMNEAKAHLDIFRKVDEQVDEMVKKLRPILPLTFEKKVLNIRLPPTYAAKLYGFVSHRAKIVDEAWLSDGAWSAKVELAAGMVNELVDELKSQTHGDVEIAVEQAKKEVKKK
ncbi:ribosome assembly factor SBDS [Candidatus Woesearchaeota archaeon]|nr:ribosome assembly factor SBDS [Candidatus Woesearchaeota archaeon]